MQTTNLTPSENAGQQMPRLCSTEEAADYLFGKTDRTTIQRLYRMIDLDQIKAKKCGGTWRLARADLLAFASEN